jgi:methylase of polypeptide subunit release factors
MQRTRANAASFCFQDPADFKRLKNAFETAGFTDAGVLEALQIDETPSLRDRDLPLLLHRTRRGTPLDTLIRLFLIETACELEAVRTAIKPLSLDVLASAGLVQIEEDSVRAAVKILPFKGFWLAFDSTKRLQTPARHDYVMGIGKSTLTLANLTVRRHARSVLDLGTGCGTQALLTAAHSEKVLAVDRNPRAVQMASFNARLNGLDQVECLEGDLFAPAEGRTFDLVVANPPFVVSPEKRYIYRDSGMPADEVCRKIVREVPDFLNEGGYCQILCNWVHTAGQDWRERLAGWFEGTGCDVWVMRSETRDAATYASTWIEHTERDTTERFQERFEQWMDYYAELGIGAVSAGLITMRRASGRSTWYRAEDGPEKMLGPCGDAVLQGFALRDFLAAVPDDASLLAARLRVSGEARLQRMLEPAAGGWADVSTELCLAHGLAYSGSVDPYVANLVAACDGRKPLGELLAEMAASLGKNPVDLGPALCGVVRSLIERGFLLPEQLPA